MSVNTKCARSLIPCAVLSLIAALTCGCSPSVNTAEFSVPYVIVELKAALTLQKESFVYNHSKCRVLSSL